MSLTYPIEKLRTEVAFIAYHFHWALGEILALSHRERVAWVAQVSAINKKILEAETK